MVEYIRMTAKVCRWHSTCTVTIPKAHAEEMNLERGDTVEILVRKLSSSQKITLEDLEDEIKKE